MGKPVEKRDILKIPDCEEHFNFIQKDKHNSWVSAVVEISTNPKTWLTFGNEAAFAGIYMAEQIIGVIGFGTRIVFWPVTTLYDLLLAPVIRPFSLPLEDSFKQWGKHPKFWTKIALLKTRKWFMENKLGRAIIRFPLFAREAVEAGLGYGLALAYMLKLSSYKPATVSGYKHPGCVPIGKGGQEIPNVVLPTDLFINRFLKPYVLPALESVGHVAVQTGKFLFKAVRGPIKYLGLFLIELAQIPCAALLFAIGYKAERAYIPSPDLIKKGYKLDTAQKPLEIVKTMVFKATATATDRLVGEFGYQNTMDAHRAKTSRALKEGFDYAAIKAQIERNKKDGRE